MYIRRKVQVRDKELGVSSVCMIFKTMEADPLLWGDYR